MGFLLTIFYRILFIINAIGLYIGLYVDQAQPIN